MPESIGISFHPPILKLASGKCDSAKGGESLVIDAGAYWRTVPVRERPAITQIKGSVYQVGDNGSMGEPCPLMVRVEASGGIRAEGVAEKLRNRIVGAGYKPSSL